MKLQARRTQGSKFTQEDLLETVLDTNNTDMASVVHTVELVSGVDVTHGGGAEAGVFLHYKAVERDANSDGIIDYSHTMMWVRQEERGVSVIRIACEAVTKSDAEAYEAAMEDWVERQQAAHVDLVEFTEEAPVLNKTLLSTGDITLEWLEDTFV